MSLMTDETPEGGNRKEKQNCNNSNYNNKEKNLGN